MRLIDVSTLRVVNVRDDEVPEYAILSHTWGTEEEEVTFQEMIAYAEIPAKVKKKASLPAAALLQRKKGFVKIVRAAEKAKEYNLDYIWIDTCCIDKTSSAELSEAINSMYRWYQQANICFALLSDVSIQSLNTTSSVEVALGNSRWFTRGWTLQELIAPFQVTFFDMNWNPLGSKEDSRLCEIIRGITRIDIDVLRGSVPLQDVSVARRMEYASRRQTTRPEDMAYCLLGLFNVHLPLLYGEGNRAFLRLQEEILKETDDQSIFAWRSFWGDSEGPEALDETLSGLLAPSPRCFEGCSLVQSFSSSNEEPTTITSRGLRTRLYLRPIKDSKSTFPEYLAVLDCYPIGNVATMDMIALEGCVRAQLDIDGREAAFTIAVYKLGDGQYARIRTNELFLTDPQEETVTELESYSTVYVKQKPTLHTPDVLLTMENTIPWWSGTRLGLREVFPPMKWSWDSFYFRTASMFWGPSIVGDRGLFRIYFQIAGSKEEQTLDIFFLLHALPNGGWTCSAYRTTIGTDMPLENAFDVYLALAAESLLDESHPIATSLTRTSLRSRSYFKLHVYLAHELDSSSTIDHIHTLQRPLGWSLGNCANELHSAMAEQTRKLTIVDRLEISVLRGELVSLPSCIPEGIIRIATETGTGTPVWQLQLQALFSPRPSGVQKTIILNDDGGPYPNLDELSFYRTAMFPILGASEFQPIPSQFTNSVIVRPRISNSEDGPSQYLEGLRHTALCPLFWAVLQGNEKLVLHLVRNQGANVDVFAPFSLSLLHAAALHGNWTPALMSVWTENNDSDWRYYKKLPTRARTVRYFDQPVHFAAAYGQDNGDDWSLLRELLQITDEMADRYFVETPLHRAAAMNNVWAVGVILDVLQSTKTADEVNSAINRGDWWGRTPLWHAAAAGAYEATAALLDHGADVDAPDKLGRTPLHAACIEGRHTVIPLLLMKTEGERGANIAARTNGVVGFTPTHFAALFGHDECIKELPPYEEISEISISSTIGVEPLTLAAANGWKRTVQALLDKSFFHLVPSNYLVLANPENEMERFKVIEYRTSGALEAAGVCGHRGVEALLEEWMRLASGS